MQQKISTRSLIHDTHQGSIMSVSMWWIHGTHQGIHHGTHQGSIMSVSMWWIHGTHQGSIMVLTRGPSWYSPGVHHVCVYVVDSWYSARVHHVCVCGGFIVLMVLTRGPSCLCLYGGSPQWRIHGRCRCRSAWRYSRCTGSSPAATPARTAPPRIECKPTVNECTACRLIVNRLHFV